MQINVYYNFASVENSDLTYLTVAPLKNSVTVLMQFSKRVGDFDILQ